MSHASLHHFIITQMIAVGYAPTIAEIASHFEVTHEVAVTALQALQAYHGVALHPQSSEVWVIHPFANAPTHFWIQSQRGSWWGNCAWCALGAAALLDEDLTITTTLGAEAKQVVVEIKNGRIQNPNFYVHFPIPMRKAWDNVIFTCSTMLLFASEPEVEAWCQRHGLPKGDVQPLQKVWGFAQVWYGNHLDPNWVKWTVDEAKEIFKQFGLIGDIWAMPDSTLRF